MSEEKPVVLDLVPLGQAQLERAQVNNQVFSGGIKEASSFLPTLGTRGRQFRIKAGKGEEVSLDQRVLDVILVTARASLSKQFFQGKFVQGVSKAPDCKSADGVRPDPDVTNPQSPTCANCRQNAIGSRINEQTGKPGKACGDHKILIVAPPTLDGDKPLQMQLPYFSQQNLGIYVKLLNHNGLAANEVVTQLGFTDDAFPNVTFKYVRNLTRDEIAQVQEIAAREDVVNTVKLPEHPAEKSPSEQQTVIVTPASVGKTEVPPQTEQPPADDKPTDEVASILSRWGATAKR